MNEGNEPLLGEAGVSGGEIADLGNVHGSPSATDSASKDRAVNTVSYCVLIRGMVYHQTARGEEDSGITDGDTSHMEGTQTLSLEFPIPDQKVSLETCTVTRVKG